ncbi:MAG: ATP-grasp domain-containing protein [Phycisphaeraceae bacterium]
MDKNIFIVGLDEPNRARLEALPTAQPCHFHRLFTYEQVQGPASLPLMHLLHEASEQLAAFPGTVDAVAGYWDFPVSDMIPILANRFALPSASLASVLRCEHKYWSRLEQGRAVPDHVPAFAAVDPEDNPRRTWRQLEGRLGVPFWLKPIKSFQSYLGFRITSYHEFEAALELMRERLPMFASPFDQLLARAGVPRDVAGIGGGHCIAEQLIGGWQVTVEGHVAHGEVKTHGIVDSIRHPNNVSFARYQYPSRLPSHVQTRMSRIVERVVRRIGLNQTAFNVELYYDEETGHIMILEINPRISQSHSDIFQKVDGVSNHLVMLELALGRTPHMPHRQGPFNIAAKCYLRRFEDGIVQRVPQPATIRALQREIPGLQVEMKVEPGCQLSTLFGQDSYSFVLAELYLGADSEAELLERYQQCEAALDFSFAPAQEEERAA